MGPVFLMLRILHIFGVMIWFGGAFTTAVFVVPTARRLGPEGGRFVQSMAGEGGLSATLTIAAWVAVFAGSVMFVMVSGGFDRTFMGSPHGILLSIGATMGILAVLHGTATQAPTAGKLAALSREISAAGGPPSPEQLARILALREKLARNGVIQVVMLAVAAAALATARYV